MNCRECKSYVLLLLVMACGLAGCKPLSPELKMDPPVKSSQWTTPQDGSFVVEKAWWTAMGDPMLDSLIEDATSQNLDLGLLIDRMRQAEIKLKGAKADQWPKLSATAGYRALFIEDFDTDSYSLGTGLGWEVDVWGRLKARKQAQRLEYKATEADWRAGYLVVVGGVSRTYLFIRQLDEQHNLHQDTLWIAQEMLTLYEQQQAAGVGTADTVSKQRADIIRLESQLQDINARRQLLLNELALILGREPGSVSIEPADLQDTVQLIAFPDQIQANLLQRRPDLIAAELRVKSAYHLQESTRAARWPQVTIGATGSTFSTAFLGSQWIAMIVPQIAFPNLDPQTKIRLQLSEVNLEASQKQYKKAVLKAINEVAGVVVTLSQHETQLTNEAKRLSEYRSSRSAVKGRVDAGVANRVELLGADLNLLAVKQRQLDLYTQLLLDQVNLHNALGGGW